MPKRIQQATRIDWARRWTSKCMQTRWLCFQISVLCGRMRDEKVKGAKKEVKNSSRFLHTITTTIQVVLVTSVRTAPPIHGGGNPYQYISRCCKQFFCIPRLSMCRHLSLLLFSLQIYIQNLPELQNCFYKLEVVVTYWYMPYWMPLCSFVAASLPNCSDYRACDFSIIRLDAIKQILSVLAHLY